MGREGKEVGFGDLLVEGAKGVGGKGGRCVGVEVLRWLLCSFPLDVDTLYGMEVEGRTRAASLGL